MHIVFKQNKFYIQIFKNAFLRCVIIVHSKRLFKCYFFSEKQLAVNRNNEWGFADKKHESAYAFLSQYHLPYIAL